MSFYSKQVNEIAWNKNSDLFFLTNGQGCVHVHTYPEMELQHVLQAHPGNCICIEFDPTGKVMTICADSFYTYVFILSINSIHLY